MEKRVISTEVLTEERSVESSLRPVKLAEYVGQDRSGKEPWRGTGSCAFLRTAGTW